MNWSRYFIWCAVGAEVVGFVQTFSKDFKTRDLRWCLVGVVVDLLMAVTS